MAKPLPPVLTGAAAPAQTIHLTLMPAQGSAPVMTYTLEKKNAQGVFVKLLSLTANQSAGASAGYDDGGNVIGKSYTYRAKAENFGGESAYSAEVTVLQTQVGTLGPPPQAPSYCAVYNATKVTTASAGETLSIPIEITNCGALGWTMFTPTMSNEITDVALSYHWYHNGSPLSWDGSKVGVSAPPNGKYTGTVSVKVPASPGTYTLKWDLFQNFPNGPIWFSTKGVAMGEGGSVTIGALWNKKPYQKTPLLKEPIQQKREFRQ
jgi:hypothetical protein